MFDVCAGPRASVLLRALCAAAFLLPFTGSAQAADPTYIYGIHWYGDPASGDAEAMSGNRKLWDLETVMLYDSGADLAAQGAKFQQVVNKGHTIIIRVQPNWGQGIPSSPAARAQYVTDIGNAAQTAANYCHIWQIGNELNLAGEYGGAHLDPTDYANFYKQVRAAIKVVSSPLGPQMVLVQPVSPGGPAGDRWMDGTQYLDTICANLGADDCDGFALHGYGAGDVAGSVASFHGNYTQQLDTIDRRGLAAKPAYITEFNRQTNPTTDAAQEAISAQFSIQAFQDLQNWNAGAYNHKVACACWFVYPNDPGQWATYSIVYLRGLNPRGVNQDLWDSFQYACTLNIPSGGEGPLAMQIVDNGAATLSGAWTLASSAVDKYGADYRYRFGSGTASTNYAEFRPNLPGGTTSLYAWWSQGTNRYTAVPYTVNSTAGSTIVNANQQSNGGRWNLLGSYTFAQGTAGYVQARDNFADATKVVIADAVKFVTTTPGDVIVDNADAGFAASANWTFGTSATDKYGPSYRFHATAAVADAATFTYTVPQNRNYEVYAWWTQGANRSVTAPYVISHASGIATVTRNQQANGGSWQSLGTYYLLSGTNNVKLSCWTTAGFVVVADAVKVVAR